MIAGSTWRLAIEQPTERVRAVLPRVVEGWGGVFVEKPVEMPGATQEETTLEIPVLAGLRRGRARGRLRLEPTPGGCEAVFLVETGELELNLAACGILLLSATGGVISMAWPWFPRLLPAVPLGLVLAVGGWLLIASRLRSSGPEEFLGALRAAALEPEESTPPSE